MRQQIHLPLKITVIILTAAATLCQTTVLAEEEVPTAEQCVAKRVTCERASKKLITATNKSAGLIKKAQKIQDKRDGIAEKVVAVIAKFADKLVKLTAQEAQFTAACDPLEELTSKACFKLERVKNRIVKIADAQKRKEEKVTQSGPKLDAKLERFGNRLKEVEKDIPTLEAEKAEVCLESCLCGKPEAEQNQCSQEAV